MHTRLFACLRLRLVLIAFALGALAGAATRALVAFPASQAVAQQPAQPKASTPDVAALAAEIETIKSKLPDQAHAMQDVGYHFTNLWFAGQEEHWDLANFYWLETRSHLRWAVRIIPKRKDNAGQEVDLPRILEALENSPLKQLQDAIAAKDKAAFDKAYRFTVEGCYACHKASDKPFLRPQIPDAPEVHVIRMKPQAEWPK